MNTQIRLRIDTREPFAEGQTFGDVGPYERLSGRVDALESTMQTVLTLLAGRAPESANSRSAQPR